MGGARRKISLASIGIGALVSRPPTTMQVFSIAEGTINWLLEDVNDRPRYCIRIAEVTPVGKKCATSATLLEVTSALLLIKGGLSSVAGKYQH